jgi:drug/metabolite transporter (DMT)-like permease
MQANETNGMLLGFIGALMFSLTLPFTRIAVAELSPYFVTFGRSSLGGICALLLFIYTRPQLAHLNSVDSLGRDGSGGRVRVPLVCLILLLMIIKFLLLI